MESFGWSDKETVSSFFGGTNLKTGETIEDSDTKTKEEKNVKEPFSDTDGEKSGKKDKDIEESSISNFFGDDDETQEELEDNDSTEEEEEEEEEEGGSLEVPEDILNVLIESELVDKDNPTLESIDEKLDKIKEDYLNSMLSSLPDEAIAMNKYLLNGGTFDEFIRKAKTSSLGNNVDFENEDSVSNYVRAYLESENYDEDLIDSNIESMIEKEKLTKFAKAIKKKKDEKRSLKLEEASDKVQAKRKKYIGSLKNELNSTEELFGSELNKKEKAELLNYISTPSIKLEDGSVITRVQNELFEAMQDPKMVIKLAQALRMGFNFKELAEKAKSEGVKSSKRKLRAPRKKKAKSLLDHF